MDALSHSYNLTSLALNIGINTLIGFSQMMVLMVGNMNIALGSMGALTALSTCSIMESTPIPIAVSLMIGLLMGLLLGAILLGIINNGLVHLNLDIYWRSLIQGLIIFAAVGADNIRFMSVRMRAIVEVKG